MILATDKTRQALARFAPAKPPQNQGEDDGETNDDSCVKSDSVASLATRASKSRRLNPVSPDEYTPETLKNYAYSYFQKHIGDQPPPNIPDLAGFLGLTQREFLGLKSREGFAKTFEMIEDRIEAYWQARLGDRSAVGAIFWLKAQKQWQDGAAPADAGQSNPLINLSIGELRVVADRVTAGQPAQGQAVIDVQPIESPIKSKDLSIDGSID